MTDWNEIDIELFKDVFTAYFSHKGSLDNKVLEIQNLRSISSGSPEARVFFGSGIKIENYKKWNSCALAISEALTSMFGSFPDFRKFEDCEISMCIFEQGPIIIPIGSTPGHDKIILSSYFGIDVSKTSDNINLLQVIDKLKEKRQNTKSSLNLYYYSKDNDKKYYLCDKNDSKEFVKKVRLRTMDLDEWKQLTHDYIISGYKLPENIYKDDVNKKDIEKMDN